MEAPRIPFRERSASIAVLVFHSLNLSTEISINPIGSSCRSLIVPYPHESPGRIRYDSVCKTAAKIVNIVKVEHTLPLRDGVCSTNAQIRDGSSYLVIRKSGTTVTPHLYSLE